MSRSLPNRPPFDRPEDWSVAWFAELVFALEREDFGRAAEAQRELDRLGWSVRVKPRRHPRNGPGRGVAR